MVRRRLRLIVAVTLLGSVISVFLALSQQRLYQSSEVIQVAQPKVDDQLAQSTVGGSTARRLQLIQQRLMTRGTVLEIVGELGLFADLPDLPPSRKVQMLRESVTIEGVAAARDGYTDDGTVSVLTITARMPTPLLAQRVAQEFSARTLELSSLSRTAKARETLEFFQTEEDKLIAEMDALEQERTQFMRDNDLAIEGNLEFRQTQIAAINDALLEIDREKVTLQRELAQLDQGQRAATLAKQQREVESQLQALEDQRTLLESRAASLYATIETTPKIERELGGFERRYEKLQSQLDLVAARRAEAEVGFKLEEQRNAEQLTVIEPAALPDFPVTPGRRKMAVLGAFASLIFGLGLALLLDMRRPVVRSAEQMRRHLGINPVVVVPLLETEGRRTPRRPGFRRMIADIFRTIRSREAAPGPR